MVLFSPLSPLMIHDSKDNRDLFFALGFFICLGYFFFVITGDLTDWVGVAKSALISFSL